MPSMILRSVSLSTLASRLSTAAPSSGKSIDARLGTSGAAALGAGQRRQLVGEPAGEPKIVHRDVREERVCRYHLAGTTGDSSLSRSSSNPSSADATSADSESGR